MSLAKRILDEKRIAVMAVGAMVVVAVVVQAFFVYPRNGQLERTRARRAQAETGLASAVRALDAVRATADGQSHADAELREFYGEILPRDLAAARGITSPTPAALARRHNLLLQRRSSVPEQDEDSRLARLRTVMLLAGNWRDIRRFIYELETSPEFIVIEDIILSQNEEVGSSLVLTLALATYYQAEEET